MQYLSPRPYQPGKKSHTPKSQYSNSSYSNSIKLATTTLKTNLETYTPNFSSQLLKISIKDHNEPECAEKRNQICLKLHKKFQKRHPELFSKFENLLNDPKFLLRFLRVCKFKEDKAYKKMVEWLKTIGGDIWPELEERLRDKAKITAFVKRTQMFVLKGAVISPLLCNNQGLDLNSPLAEGSDPADFDPWMVLASVDPEVRTTYKEINDYFLDVAASSIIATDYCYKKEEAFPIIGCYLSNIITNTKKRESSLLFFIKNFPIFKKLIKIWTSTSKIKNLGFIHLNYQPTMTDKMLSKMVGVFQSEKVKKRKIKLGKDWIEDGIFVRKGLPECYGGGLESERGLEWIDEYFEKFRDCDVNGN